MTEITNTTKRMQEVPNALEGLPEMIEASERRGQSELVASTKLPVDTRGGDDDFLALGFTFGEPDGGDPIFRSATLPEGWTRRGSDHAMWSYIDDAEGNERVAIFYKAAFYDRSAFMYLVKQAVA